jgi:hypothetical protein
MIAALAGRRIDAPDTHPSRFPAAHANRVNAEVLQALIDAKVDRLVASGACGADLLGLQAAEQLNIPRTIVLPYDPAVFRKTSVVDRGLEWGSIYDHLLTVSDVVDLGLDAQDPNAYLTASRELLKNAELAIVVWDGLSRGPDDITEAFLNDARRYGLTTVEISTIG